MDNEKNKDEMSNEKIDKKKRKKKAKHEDKGVRQKKVMKTDKLLIIAVMIIVVWAVAIQAYNQSKPMEADMNYTEFKQLLDDKDIESANIVNSLDKFNITTKSGESYSVINPKYEDFRKDLLEAGVDVKVSKYSVSDSISALMMNLPFSILMIILCVFIVRQMRSFSNSMFNLLKDNSAITFDNVAGIGEIKKDVQFAIDTLVNRGELIEAGGRPTKGIILEGPPGTGKTLIARAIAGEAKVPFISVSGSDFIEMFVGLGAARVRTLWQLAIENAPCVVFIDEIDAVGERRMSSNSGGQSEANQTLNALLQKMDGLSGNRGILVIGATNRVADLDPALIRPGRFDKKIYVGPPTNKKDRDEIIRVHLRNKIIENLDEDFDKISKALYGMTGAEIENVLNESVVVSIQHGRHGVLTFADIDEASMKLRVNGVVVPHFSEQDRNVSAIHEAGHAVMNLLLGRAVTKVSVTNYSSGVGGVTISDVDATEHKIKFRKELKEDIYILLAGTASERIEFGDSTVGCSNDLERATQIMKNMLFTWGMEGDMVISTEGLKGNNNISINNEYEMQKVNEELNKALVYTVDKLKPYSNVIKKIANRLLEEEVITDLDFKVLDE